MYAINKNTNLNRIEIAISGDEILGMLPECMTEFMVDNTNKEIDDELEQFTKGVYVAFVPIDKIKVTGFL